MSREPADKFSDRSDHVSHLRIERFATGELTGSDRAAAQAWLAQNPRGFAHLEALKDARRRVRPLDVISLRARAGGLTAIEGERMQATSAETFPPGMLDGRDLLAEVKNALRDDRAAAECNAASGDEEVDRSTVPFAEERLAGPGHENTGEIADQTGPSEPPIARRGTLPSVAPHQAPALRSPLAGAPPRLAAASRPSLWLMIGLVPLVLLAIGIAMMTLPRGDGSTGGSGSLEVRELSDGAMRAWDGRALGAGDVVGFAVAPGAHDRVVVVSVDAAGRVSQWYPAIGEPETIKGAADAASIALDASVTLDGSPGAEVFVAMFDRGAEDAVSAVTAEFASGGTKRVAAWAEADPHADAVVVKKRQ